LSKPRLTIRKIQRGTDDVHKLANGPAILCQALGIISTELSGKKLGPKTLELLPANGLNNDEIVISKRVGIKKAIDEPWRFYIKNNPFVSRV
jgi:DNA-3-methyladenine glycosylase